MNTVSVDPQIILDLKILRVLFLWKGTIFEVFRGKRALFCLF